MITEDNLKNWTTFTVTPSLSNFTGTSTKAMWKRVDGNIELNHQLVATTVTGQVAFTSANALPSGLGLTVDTTRFNSGAFMPAGTWHAKDVSGSLEYDGTIVVNDSGTIFMLNGTGGFVNATSPFTWAASDQLNLRWTLPILQWAQQPGSAIGFAFADTNNGGLVSTGTQSISGAKTFLGGAALRGTITNDAAATGYVGEYLSQSRARNALATVTNTPLNVTATALTLTAGDWDLSGGCNWTTATTTSVTATGCAISVTSATLPASSTITNPNAAGEIWIPRDTAAYVPGNSADHTVVIPQYRVSIASTTTFYLVATQTFTVSTLNVGGFIAARRVR